MKSDNPKNEKIRRGEKMKTSCNCIVKEVETGNLGTEFRKLDDMRLPMSPMTYEEFIKAEQLLKECVQVRQEMMKAGTLDQVPHFFRAEGNPLFPLYKYLSELREKKLKAGIIDERDCIICGDELDRKCTPYCLTCGRELSNGRLRGRNNTMGYRNWQRRCCVCNLRQANPNMKGMCRTCYRLGERNNTHDPEEVRKLRRIRLRRAIKKGDMISRANASAIRMEWVRKNWPQ